MIKCPHCGKEFSIGCITSEKKAAACRENGKMGGRPKGATSKGKLYRKRCAACGEMFAGVWYGSKKTGYLCQECYYSQNKED